MDHGLPSWLYQLSKGQLNMSNFVQDFEEDEHHSTVISQSSNESPNPIEHPITTSSKKKRNLPGNPDPDAEVVALSPRTLMATNRYICEVCQKGFQRDQNLQLHRRGHNLPWKLKQRTNTEVKKRVYVCPEPNCVHHHPSRALGDLTGIKKHFCRKHGEKKWKCDKCSKRYAVQSDWKAHAKICGTREYRCDCGTIFSRKDSFVTHRAFCDALTEENYKVNRNHGAIGGSILQKQADETMSISDNTKMDLSIGNESMDNSQRLLSLKSTGIMNISSNLDQIFNPTTSLASTLAIGSAYTSATALLQKAAQMGAKISDNTIAPILLRGFAGYSTSNMNSSGSVQDGSNGAGTNGLYVGEETSHNPLAPTALFDSHFLQAENGKAANLLGQVYMEGGQKLTVDFLGVEPTGHQNVDNERNYDGNIMNLGYSNAQEGLNNLRANW